MVFPPGIVWQSNAMSVAGSGWPCHAAWVERLYWRAMRLDSDFYRTAIRYSKLVVNMLPA